MTRPIWRKSSRSTSSSNCVEVATNVPNTVGVRDSKHPHGPALTVPSMAWGAFLHTVKTSALDLEA